MSFESQEPILVEGGYAAKLEKVDFLEPSTEKPWSSCARMKFLLINHGIYVFQYIACPHWVLETYQNLQKAHRFVDYCNEMGLNVSVEELKTFDELKDWARQMIDDPRGIIVYLGIQSWDGAVRNHVRRAKRIDV